MSGVLGTDAYTNYFNVGSGQYKQVGCAEWPRLFCSVFLQLLCLYVDFLL